MQPAPVDPGVLGARLRQQQLMDDPVIGRAEPLEVEARSVLWPHALQWALIELVSLTEDGARRVEEYRCTPAAPAAELPAFSGLGLPLAIVFERTPNGASRARVYSVRTLRRSRTAALAVDTHLQPGRDPSDALARHLAALRAGDVAAMLDSFDARGYLQDFDGAVHQGRTQLRALSGRCSERGGTQLRYCTCIQDGPHTALELLDAAERPALAVYERAAGGALAAVRLYG